MRKAVIAIGSNSTRMLVAECGGVRPQIICRARESTRLLMHMENGVLTPEGIICATRDVAKLLSMALAHGAKTTALFATSAARSAINSAALAASILGETGLSLSILPGEAEARLAYFAATGGGDGVVVDIGGGSTEITLGARGVITFSESVAVGSSRLLMEFQEIKHFDDAENVMAAVRERLRPMTEHAGVLGCRVMYGIGGTCVTSACILTHGGAAEGVLLTRKEVMRQLILISPMTLSERAALPGLPAARAIHMPHGLCILYTVMDALKADSLTVSERTNMDGYLLSPDLV